MEIVLLVIVLILLAWWLGFIKAGQKLAGIGNDKVAALAAEQKAQAINAISKINIDEDTYNKAKENLSKVDKFDLL